MKSSVKFDLKLYRGYMSDYQLVVFGHVFKSWAPERYRLDRRGVRHAFSILHMFRIVPLDNVDVSLHFHGLKVHTRSMSDGYFRFDIPFVNTLEGGWYDFEVYCDLHGYGLVETGQILKPFASQLAMISDIDDTFLISYSNQIFKKLFVMLSRNINKRKIFTNVVRHYQLLSVAGQKDSGRFNSFFFVSSSEWNLYGFIEQFARIHELPKAVLKLKKIKTGIRDFLFTGRGDHDHKFHKIKDIIMFYPHLRYVLLGDDSQHDPRIYERIVKIFPKNIRAVYIRQIRINADPNTQILMNNMNELGVDICYHSSSEEAIAHSVNVGLI